MGEEEEREEVKGESCSARGLALFVVRIRLAALFRGAAAVVGARTTIVDAPIWLLTNQRVSCFIGPSFFLLTRRTSTTLLLACLYRGPFMCCGLPLLRGARDGLFEAPLPLPLPWLEVGGVVDVGVELMVAAFPNRQAADC